MSVFSVQISIGDAERRQWVELSASVDVSNPVSFLPGALLRELEIAPSMTRSFTMENGSIRNLDFGYAWLRLNEREGMTYFVFDEENGQPRLGRIAINSLLLEVDQAHSKLVPMTNLFL